MCNILFSERKDEWVIITLYLEVLSIGFWIIVTYVDNNCILNVCLLRYLCLFSEDMNVI